MEWDLKFILSVLSLLISGSVVVWMKVLANRSFKMQDQVIGDVKASAAKLGKDFETAIKEIKQECIDLDECNRKLEKDQIRFEEKIKNLTTQFTQFKSEFDKEIKLVTTHLETIHNKISHVDETLEKVRDRR